MRIITSPYPPVPQLKPQNHHSFTFEQRPATDIPLDHVIHINGLTGEERTYGQFLERVRDGATALAADSSVGGLGLKPRCTPPEIVGILSPNCLDYIVLIHACLRLTIPFALLPAHPTAAELVFLIRRSKATRIFAHPDTLQLAYSAAKEAGFPIASIYLLEGHDPKHPGFDSLITNVRKNNVPRRPMEPADYNTLAYLVFSSGTGGLPKAVMITHGNVNFSLKQYNITVQETAKVVPKRPPGPPPRGLCVLPFYHTYGLHVSVFRTFFQPITYVVLPRWDTELALNAIPRFKINTLALVPSQIHQLVHHPRVQRTDLSSVVGVATGGAYLSAELARKMQETFSPKTIAGAKGKQETEFMEGYGMSEGTISSLVSPRPGVLGLQPVKGSLGVLMTGQEGRIVREDGSDADVNEPGELWIRGGNIAIGYWQDEKATKETFLPDGWLRTGDRFRVDENGFFFFDDRVKDILKVSGAQVSPAELENTLLEHPEKLINDVAVAGVLPFYAKTASEDRVPRAWIVLSASGHIHGSDEVIRKLEAWSRERLSKYKWLKGGFGVVPSIPKNPTGKVLRRVLRDEHEKAMGRTIQATAKL